MLKTFDNLNDKETLNTLWRKANLTKEEKMILKRHYGFNYGNGGHTAPQTLHHITRLLKTEYSVVKALHDSALEKLRLVAKENKITWRGMSI